MEREAQVPQREWGMVQFSAIPNSDRGRGGLLRAIRLQGYIRDQIGIKRHRGQTDSDVRKRTEMRSGGMGGPLLYSPPGSHLEPFAVLGLTTEGDREGLHPAEWGESGEPEAPRSPVSTAQAHLP